MIFYLIAIIIIIVYIVDSCCPLSKYTVDVPFSFFLFFFLYFPTELPSEGRVEKIIIKRERKEKKKRKKKNVLQSCLPDSHIRYFPLILFFFFSPLL